MCTLEDLFTKAVALRKRDLEEENTSCRDLEVETWSQIVAECYSIGIIPKYIELKHSAPINSNRMIEAAKDLFDALSIEIEYSDTKEKWTSYGHYIYITLGLAIE